MTEINAPLSSDLPPRTWRRWWLEWPKWFRIGCWAALMLGGAQLLLTAGLAIRIHYGLKDPPEFLTLRRPGVHLMFESGRRGEPFQGFNRLMDGIKGRSCHDVIGIRLDEHATDADLELIGRSFPNLESLHLARADVTTAGLEHLSSCQRLRALDLQETDLADSAAEILTKFLRLSQVDLTGTLFTNAALAPILELPALQWLNVCFTDISSAAIAAARANAPGGKLDILSEQDSISTGILGSIRWPDGSRSGRFAGSFELRCAGPIVDGRSQGSFGNMSSKLTRRQMWWDTKQLQGRPDGTYHFTAKLGNCESAPAVVTIQDGQPSTRLIEFRMPCTQAEALQLAAK